MLKIRFKFECLKLCQEIACASLGFLYAFSSHAFPAAPQPPPRTDGAARTQGADEFGALDPAEDIEVQTRAGFVRKMRAFLSRDKTTEEEKAYCVINPESQFHARQKVKKKVAEYTIIAGNSTEEFGHVAHMVKSKHEEYFFVLKENGTLFEWNHKGSLKATFPDLRFKKVLNFAGVLMLLDPESNLYMYEPGSDISIKLFKSGVRDISIHSSHLVLLEEDSSASILRGRKGTTFKVKEVPVMGTALADSSFVLENSELGEISSETVPLSQPIKTLSTDIFFQEKVLVFSTTIHNASEEAIDLEELIPAKATFNIDSINLDLGFAHTDTLSLHHLDVTPGDNLDTQPSIKVGFRFHRSFKHPTGVTPRYELFYEEVSPELLKFFKSQHKSIPHEFITELSEALIGKGEKRWEISGMSITD